MRLMRIGPIDSERPVLLGGHEALTPPRSSRTSTGPGGSRADRRGWPRPGATGHQPQVAIDGQRIGAPVARPGKVVCIGLNHRDHAAETGAAIPKEPIIFMKDPHTVIGSNDTVLIPRKSIKTDWEVELAVIIGSPAHDLDGLGWQRQELGAA